MSEISLEIMQQLENAQVSLAQSMVAGGPPMTAGSTTPNLAETTFGAAGSGQAKYLLLDHYTTSSTRILWAHSGDWRSANVTNTEEQGLAQVAFAANRVDVWWDNSNKITLMRCWKNL
ncbi:hypothetical protein Ping_1672 [Psychromonas ingrahamii 37]|uniref:Uncharacterized protein n=1 Tax=Psychromonas ingrahamii (strain DSM 17664 / CCUG 51855 / 37) TaxID=357804 RepID=A1SVE9_PSYIN|nr:hypothetical protein [Psychromonas ingrahamii]ABM03464.1 hypothetical protein Ping_1672 [Psychromonas ingrahamii 37]